MRNFFQLAVLGFAACSTNSMPKLPAPPPPVIYAWATFDRDKLHGSGAGGEADRAARRVVTIDDPVRVASVSKLVVAIGVMRLVEEGRLQLDDDVSETLGWRLRNPAFPDQPITLRLLLSHRSSIRDQGENYVIPLGGTVRETLLDARSYDDAHSPGNFFRYSNLNYVIIASVMEKASGERFDELMARLVLGPLALSGCFNWSGCDDLTLGKAVVLYEEDGSPLRDNLQGRRPDCLVIPARDGSCDLGSYVLGTNGALFSPQGGLRISMRDLASIGRVLLNDGDERGRPFLSESSIATILGPEWQFDGKNGITNGGFYCAYGLGAQLIPLSEPACRDELFGNRKMIGHAGEAYRVRSGLWIDQARGVGIAYFAANNGNDPRPGRTAYTAVEEWLAAKLGN